MTILIEVEREFQLRPLVPHDQMNTAMRERGAVILRIFRQLVDALSAVQEDEPPSRVDPHEDIDTDEVRGTAPPKNARTASPRRIQEPRGDDICSQVSPHDIFGLDVI